MTDHDVTGLLKAYTTGNLDPALSLEVMALFKRFNDVGVTVVVATHDLEIVRAWGLREIVVEDGRVKDPAAPSLEVPTMEAQR